jgi:hypothetical protein
VITFLLRLEICVFHWDDNEDGYCIEGCDAVKFGRSV